MNCARRLGVRGAFLLPLLLLCSSSVFAQLPTGTILGTVKDSTGGAVAGANVTVTNTDTGVSRTGPTQDDGSYRFPALAVGNYSITVTKDGFQTTQRTGLMLVVGQEAAIDITLQVGSTSQSVVVTGEAPLVDTTSSTVGALVNDQQVADLPLNGRNLVNLTLMEPGIAQTTVIPTTTIGSGFMTGVTFSSNGAPIHSNNYMLDGADMVGAMGLNNSSIIGTTLGVDGVKEYKVVTNLPDASYGLTMGSQTTIVSKGGSNQFHGDVFDYLRNSSMDSRNYFDALDKLDFNGDGTDKSLDFPGKRIPPFRRNNFGASLGGPIRKDKTFFYAVYEGVRSGTGETITTTTLPYNCFTAATPHVVTSATLLSCSGLSATATVNPTSLFLLTANLYPGQTGLFPYPNANISSSGAELAGATYDYSFPYIEPAQEDYGQLRLDENFSNSDSFFGRYTQDDAQETANRSYAYQRDMLFGGQQFATLSETHIFSPTLLNTARFSFSRNVSSGISTTTPPPPTSILLQPGQSEPGGITPAGTVTGLAFLAADGRYINNPYTYSDDVFWTKGKNAFKFGVLFNNFHVPENGHFESQGTVSFTTLANFTQGIYSSMTALGGTLSPSQYRYWGYKTVGFYAQDDLRATSRLTLNLGLRYEFDTMPTNLVGPNYQIQDIATANGDSPTQGAVQSSVWQNNPSLHAISPRIGFALDPTGSGKTAVRGGAGIYYDVGNFGALLFQLACCEPPLDYFNTINNSTSSLAAMQLAGLPTFQIPLPIAYGSAPVTASNPEGVISTVQGIASPRNWSYHWNQPTIYQWNLTVDQQLPGNQSVTIGYIGSRGVHLVELEEGNPTTILGYLSNGLPYYCHPADSPTGPPTTADQCPTTSTFPAKTNPTYGIVNQDSAGSESWYNAMQINYTKRVGHGLQGQISYTWAKLLDTGQGQQGLEAGVAEATYFPQVQYLDKGPAGFNIPQNLRGNLIYHAPDLLSDKRVVGKVLSGWWVGSIVSLQSGYSLNPLIGNRSLSNNPAAAGSASDRPNLDPSFDRSTVITNNPSNWFNESMYDLPLAGTLGNAPRDGLRGPDLRDWDFSLNKDTKAGFLGEAGTVEFRVEIFNILNHPNFSNPNATIASLSSPAAIQCGPQFALSNTSAVKTSPSCQFQSSTDTASPLAANSTAGQITSTVTTSRQVQLSLKMIF